MAASTTLTTFLLQTPPTIRSVRLLGSWDNFSTEYPMEKDSRMGRGNWRGCHTFRNITCDGNVKSVGDKRDGGLKMGGKYWYYYHLDGEVEYHNPSEPSTTSCPFLPGQPVNVLEVPIELGSDGVRGRSGSASIVFTAIPAVRTMDPGDKFTSPRAAPIPRLARLATSPASLTRLTRSESSSPIAGVPSSWSSRSGCSSPASSTSSATLSRFLPFSRKESVSEPTSAVSAPTSRGRCGPFSRDRWADKETKMEIGAPSLVQCTNPELQCIPLSQLNSTRQSFATVSSRSSSRDTSPLRRYVVTRSRETSPLGMKDVEREDASMEHVQRHSSSSTRSRESSRLRLSLSAETDSDEETSPFPALEDDDDFNFRVSQLNSSEEDAETEAFAGGLAPAPTRSHPRLTNLPSLKLRSASFDTNPLPLSPTFASHAQEVPSQSHFSMYSTTTASTSAPTSPSFDELTFSDYPGSPSLSTTTDSSRASRHLSGLSPTELTPTGDGLGLDAWDRVPTIPDEADSPSSVCDSLHALRPNGKDYSSKRNAAYFGPSSVSSGFTAFQGYSLPSEETGSVTTLRKLSEASAHADLVSGTVTTNIESDLSLPATQRLSTLEEMMSELGYLGEMIV